jgi:AraC-like DNA-binding protein
MGVNLKNLLRWQNLKIHVSPALHSREKEGPATPEHRHEDFLELVFVRSGQAIHVVGDREAPIATGHIFLIREQCEHYYRNAQSLNIYNILLDRGFLAYFKDDLQSLPNYQLLFNLERDDEKAVLMLDDRHFPDAVKLLENIIAEEANDTPGARTIVLGDVLRLFVFLFRHARPVLADSGGNSGHAYKISRLLAALDQRCQEDWSLEKMAAMTRMSVMNFRLEFKRLTGLPPINYLLKTRLTKAALMLMLPGKNISEVALACGFQDSNYFTRQFRAEYGMTPREFRLQP